MIEPRHDGDVVVRLRCAPRDARRPRRTNELLPGAVGARHLQIEWCRRGRCGRSGLQHQRAPPSRRADGERFRGHAGRQTFGRDLQRPGVAVDAVREHVKRLRPALPECGTRLEELAVRHRDRAEVRLRRSDAQPVGGRRAGQVARLAAPDDDVILAVFRGRELIRPGSGGAGREPEGVQRVLVVVLLTAQVALGVLPVAHREEEVARGADPLGRQFDLELVALLRVERDPVALVPLRQEAGDLARSGQHLGGLGRARGLGLHGELVAREVNHHRVRRSAGTLDAVSESVLQRGDRIDAAQAAEFPDGVGRGSDAHDELFERATVGGVAVGGLAPGQVAAVEGHLGGLARFHDRREHGVNPRRGCDRKPVEVVRAARGVGELAHANQVVAVGRQNDVGERVVVVRVAVGRELPPGAVEHFHER